MEDTPKVDLCFSITGKAIPVDHGFELYSAISMIIPEFHQNCNRRGPVQGRVPQQGQIQLQLVVGR